jgi:hypothetical protein
MSSYSLSYSSHSYQKDERENPGNFLTKFIVLIKFTYLIFWIQNLKVHKVNSKSRTESESWQRSVMWQYRNSCINMLQSSPRSAKWPLPTTILQQSFIFTVHDVSTNVALNSAVIIHRSIQTLPTWLHNSHTNNTYWSFLRRMDEMFVTHSCVTGLCITGYTIT